MTSEEAREKWGTDISRPTMDPMDLSLMRMENMINKMKDLHQKYELILRQIQNGPGQGPSCNCVHQYAHLFPLEP
jgi:hypothetical protein